MKKYIFIFIVALIGFLGCKKEKIEVKNDCPKVERKRSQLVVANVYYYYLILSNGDELLVSESEYYNWSIGAVYAPKCVK